MGRRITPAESAAERAPCAPTSAWNAHLRRRVQWKHIARVCPECDGTWLKERQMFIKCRSCGAWFLSAKWAAEMVELKWWVAMRSVQAHG